MVVGILPFFIKGIAGKLPAFHQDVVAARPLHGQTKAGSRFLNHLGLPGHIVIGPGNKEGEVQVSQIVEHGTPAGETAGQMPAVFFQLFHPAFLPGVLILSDDHRLPVLPQIQGAAFRRIAFHQKLFQCQVMIGVFRSGGNEPGVLDHLSKW